MGRVGALQRQAIEAAIQAVAKCEVPAMPLEASRETQYAFEPSGSDGSTFIISLSPENNGRNIVLGLKGGLVPFQLIRYKDLHSSPMR